MMHTEPYVKSDFHMLLNYFQTTAPENKQFSQSTHQVFSHNIPQGNTLASAMHDEHSNSSSNYSTDGSPAVNYSSDSDQSEDDLMEVAIALEQLKEAPTSEEGGKKKSTRSAHSMFDGLMFEKPKKKRRKSNEIERLYPCPFHQCAKSYGSEAALKTHIRIKHKTDKHDLVKLDLSPKQPNSPSSNISTPSHSPRSTSPDLASRMADNATKTSTSFPKIQISPNECRTPSNDAGISTKELSNLILNFMKDPLGEVRVA